MSSQEFSVYPTVFGVEEELEIEGHYPGYTPSTIDVSDLKTALNDYRGMAARGTPSLTYGNLYETTHQNIHAAGDKTYVDGISLERSTAECSTVRAAITRSRGVERFAAGIAECLIGSDTELEIIHRRRVGNFADLVGTQDNIYVPAAPDADPEQHKRRVKDMLIAIAVTRPYMTGAGEYKDGQFFFAQKLAGLGQYWARHELSVQPVATGGDRYEIRENDINICDAAAMMRLGGSAIGAAVAQTPLFEHFADTLDDLLRHRRSQVDWIDSFNIPAMNPDGSFATAENAHIFRATEFFLRLAEVFASNDMRREAGEQPAELMEIARQIHAYTEDMRDVLRNELPVQALLQRSDWAAKHSNGGPRWDYDTLRFRRVGDSIETKKAGLGFIFRDMGFFAGGISQAEVDQAYFTAPTDTRAAVRAKLMNEYWAADIKWDQVTLLLNNPYGYTIPLHLLLEDPRQSELSQKQLSMLQQALRRTN